MQENFLIDGTDFFIDTDTVFSKLKIAFQFDKPLQENMFSTYKKYYVTKRNKLPFKEYLGLKNINMLDNFTIFLVKFILKKYKLELYSEEKVSKVKGGVSANIPLNFLTDIYQNNYNGGIYKNRTQTINFEKLKGTLPMDTVISNKTEWETIKDRASDCIGIIDTNFSVYVIADRNFKRIEKEFPDNMFSAYITRHATNLQIIAKTLARLEFVKRYSNGNLFDLKVHFSVLDKIFNAFMTLKPESNKMLELFKTNFPDLDFHITSLKENIISEYTTFCKNMHGSTLTAHVSTLNKIVNLLGDLYVDPKNEIEKEFSTLIHLYNTLLDLINYDNDLLILASIGWTDADSSNYSYKIELTKKTAEEKLITHIKQRIHSYEQLYHV